MATDPPPADQPAVLPAVRIALIHNGDPERLATIRPPIQALVTRLGATSSEHHWQPPLESHPYTTLQLFRGGRRDERMHRQHLRFRGRRAGSSALLPALRAAVGALLRPDPVGRFPGAVIERLVTEKHLRAWTAFLDRTDDVLIVFEDDAGFLPTSGDRLVGLLSHHVRPDVPTYVDLAGGFPLRKLVDASRATSITDGLLAFPEPFGNTTAGYLVTRPLVERMLQEVLWHPDLRHTGPDWLVNELLMRVHAHRPVVCLHGEPSMLTHGTFTGAFASAIAPRPVAKPGG
jgi:hypothetical protein